MRKSSSTSPASRNGAIACGPPSERISRWPRSRSAATARTGSTVSPSATIAPSGSRPGEPRGAGVGGEHDRAGRERRVLGVDAPAAGDDRDLGLRRAPAAAAAARRTPPQPAGSPAPPSRSTSARRPSFPTRSPARRSRRGATRAGTGRLRSPRRRSCSTRPATGSRPPRRASRRSSRTREAPRTRATRRTPRRAPRAARTPAARAPRTAPPSPKGLAPPALALPGRVRGQSPCRKPRGSAAPRKKRLQTARTFPDMSGDSRRPAVASLRSRVLICLCCRARPRVSVCLRDRVAGAAGSADPGLDSSVEPVRASSFGRGSRGRPRARRGRSSRSSSSSVSGSSSSRSFTLPAASRTASGSPFASTAR